MPLELHPLEEADMAAFTDIMWESFTAEGGIMGLMYLDGYSPEARQHSTDRSLAAWRKHPEKIKKMKVIDTELPDDDQYKKIVGLAEWLFYPQERSQAELDEEVNEAKEGGLPPGANAAMMEDFFAAIGKVKKEYHRGDSHIRLHLLATLPKHHRRGVGAMHMRWGFAEADRLGLNTFLEGSPMGTPLYAREGFETVGWLDFDAKKHGSPKDIPHAIMKRPAKKA